MRVSREQAGKNRAAIVQAASRLLRGRGLDGVGIADIMQAAGLTHGGFYGQFSSREQLVVEAVRAAIASARRKWLAAISAAPEAPLRAVADFYLTPAHRDQPERGCAFAALASDAARAGTSVKAAFGAGLEEHLQLIEQSLAGQGLSPDAARQAALAALSTLVGGLILSRAVDDPHLSDAFLQAASSRIDREPDG